MHKRRVESQRQGVTSCFKEALQRSKASISAESQLREGKRTRATPYFVLFGGLHVNVFQYIGYGTYDSRKIENGAAPPLHHTNILLQKSASRRRGHVTDTFIAVRVEVDALG